MVKMFRGLKAGMLWTFFLHNQWMPLRANHYALNVNLELLINLNLFPAVFYKPEHVRCTSLELEFLCNAWQERVQRAVLLWDRQQWKKLFYHGFSLRFKYQLREGCLLSGRLGHTESLVEHWNRSSFAYWPLDDDVMLLLWLQRGTKPSHRSMSESVLSFSQSWYYVPAVFFCHLQTCKHKGTPVETQREFHANFETYQRDMAKSEYLSLMLISAELENPQGLWILSHTM